MYPTDSDAGPKSHLPFLLATIPLAVRSALISGTGGTVVARLVFWLVVTLVVVSVIAVVVSAVIFAVMPLEQSTISRIGALFGASATQADIELALNPQLGAAVAAKEETGLVSVVPTNVFSALSANDTMRVIIFLAILGTGMVLIERRSGES